MLCFPLYSSIGTFRESYVPTIEDTYRQVISSNKNVCTLQITDTTGSHQFPAMQRLNITKGHAFMLVYSVTSKQSMEELIPIYREIMDVKVSAAQAAAACQEAAAGVENGSATSAAAAKAAAAAQALSNLPIILVGNKCDEESQREVTPEYTAEMVAKILFGCGSIETSAKTGYNVHEAFQVGQWKASGVIAKFLKRFLFFFLILQELLSMDKSRNMSLKMDLKKSRSQLRKEKLKGHCLIM